MLRRGAGPSFAVAALLAQLCLAGDCVDGVTPDCSDPASQCGPDLDGSTFDAVAPSDATTDRGLVDAAPPNDAGSGADSSDADASDQ